MVVLKNMKKKLEKKPKFKITLTNMSPSKIGKIKSIKSGDSKFIYFPFLFR